MIRNRNGYWQVRVYAGLDPLSGRKRWRYDRARSEVEARAVERRLLAEVAPARRRQRQTVAELLARWVEWGEQVRELSPSTLVAYRHWITRVILPGLGELPVGRVTADRIERFYVALRQSGGVRGKGLSASSVRDVHAILTSAFTRAVVWGWLPANPALAAAAPPIKRPERTPPTVEEVARLLTAAVVDERWFGLLLRLAALAGARRGELCGLRWSDLDPDRGDLLIARGVVAVPRRELLVRATKTHAVRRVALDPGTLGLLRAHHAQVQATAGVAGTTLVAEAFMFSPVVDGSVPLRPDGVNQRFNRLRERVGLTYRLHDLRHFMVTELLTAGVDVYTVSKRAGHDSSSVTLNVDAHVRPAQDREAAERIGKVCDQALVALDRRPDRDASRVVADSGGISRFTCALSGSDGVACYQERARPVRRPVGRAGGRPV